MVYTIAFIASTLFTQYYYCLRNSQKKIVLKNTNQTHKSYNYIIFYIKVTTFNCLNYTIKTLVNIFHKLYYTASYSLKLYYTCFLSFWQNCSFHPLT